MLKNIPPATQKKVLLLLLLVALGCLGALPIASHLLIAQTGSASRTYTDGQCTTRVLAVIYKPAVSQIPVPASLPTAWKEAGRGAQDYPKALACAATFVQTYETFDYHQVNTLYKALPFLSMTAQKRFYTGDTKTSPNIRTDQSWQKRLQKAQIIQAASTSVPTLLASEYVQQTLYLTLVVPYSVIVQQAGHAATTHTYNETVLLKSASPAAIQAGIGWQVSDWHENQ